MPPAAATGRAAAVAALAAVVFWLLGYAAHPGPPRIAAALDLCYYKAERNETHVWFRTDDGHLVDAVRPGDATPPPDATVVYYDPAQPERDPIVDRGGVARVDHGRRRLLAAACTVAGYVAAGGAIALQCLRCCGH